MEVEKDICMAGKECRRPAWTCLLGTGGGGPVGGLWGPGWCGGASAALPTQPTFFRSLGS